MLFRPLPGSALDPDPLWELDHRQHHVCVSEQMQAALDQQASQPLPQACSPPLLFSSTRNSTSSSGHTKKRRRKWKTRRRSWRRRWTISRRRRQPPSCSSPRPNSLGPSKPRKTRIRKSKRWSLTVYSSCMSLLFPFADWKLVCYQKDKSKYFLYSAGETIKVFKVYLKGTQTLMSKTWPHDQAIRTGAACRLQ